MMTKHLSILYFIVFFSIQINAIEVIVPTVSDTINRIGMGGQKAGYWIIRDQKEDVVKERGRYVEGKKDGIWLAFFSNGNKKSEITYIKGEARGKAFFYYKSGVLSECGNWQVNHWEGNYKFYHKNGKISYNWNYNKKGKRAGNQKYYYDNGKPKYIGTWEDGMAVGILKLYNEQGILVEEKNYEEGKVVSVHLVKAKVSSEIIHEDDVADKLQFKGGGFHTIYNLSGNVHEKGIYKNGKLIDGERYLYDADNLLLKILMIKEGIEVGFRRPK